MGKQFNIKDARSIELMQDLAARKGKSVTATIRDLLEAENSRMAEDVSRRVVEITAAFDRLRAQIPPDLLKLSSKEWMDAIYDEDGFPEK